MRKNGVKNNRQKMRENNVQLLIVNQKLKL